MECSTLYMVGKYLAVIILTVVCKMCKLSELVISVLLNVAYDSILKDDSQYFPVLILCGCHHYLKLQWLIKLKLTPPRLLGLSLIK